MIDVNDGVDSTEDHIKAAKAYLLKASSRSGQTMYVLSLCQYVTDVMLAILLCLMNLFLHSKISFFL